VIKTRLLFLPLLLLLAAGCTPRFDRQAMLENIVNEVILPALEAFTDRTAELESEARSFSTNPSAEGLTALQESWLAAALAWKRAELYPFGGTILLHTSIEKRPVNDEFIEEFIATEPVLDEDFIERIGSTAKGLGAVEYLIFDPEKGDEGVLESFSDPRRRAYLAALAANLNSRAETLHAAWAPDGDNYQQTFIEAAADGADLDGSISMLANEMIERTEMMVKDKIGAPLGKDAFGDPSPESAEAYRSGASLELSIATVEALRATFNAGLDDYLVHLGGEATAGSIAAQFETVLADLAAVGPPLEEAVLARPERVEPVYESLRGLLKLVKTDMANQMGITITFSDNDGD
jgi:predicted lipoprotein